MKSTRLRYVERQLFSGQFAGAHDFNFGEPTLEGPEQPNVSMDWRLTYSRASRDEPDTRENIYEERDNDFLFRDVTHSGSRFFFDLEDDEYNARVDWKVRVGTDGLFKFGGLLRDRTRIFDVRRFRFLPSDQVDAIVNLSAPPEILFQSSHIAPRVFELRESTRSTDNYLADHNIYSGYLMLDLPLSPRWQMMSGVRLESSDQRVTTFDPFAATRTEINASLETLDWLPGLNVTYRITERMNLRFAASRTITRPDFRELAPFEFTDFVGGRTILGNPDLERTQIDNFDFRWEVFPQMGGVVAVSAFYKRFQKPIEQIVQPQAEVRITYENAEGAHNYGLELEARQNLGVISEALNKFSINTNVALISSQVVLPEGIGIQTSFERPLQGQCPYIVNVSVGYENPNWGISSAMTYNVFGNRLSEVGNHGVPDVYEQARGQLDATFSRVVADDFKLSFSAKNLLNPDVYYKMGDADYLRYKIGRSFSLGVSYNL